MFPIDGCKFPFFRKIEFQDSPNCQGFLVLYRKWSVYRKGACNKNILLQVVEFCSRSGVVMPFRNCHSDASCSQFLVLCRNLFKDTVHNKLPSRMVLDRDLWEVNMAAHNTVVCWKRRAEGQQQGLNFNSPVGRWMMNSWGNQFEQGQAKINYYLPLLLFNEKRWWKLQDDNCHWLVLEQEEKKGEMGSLVLCFLAWENLQK